jgi:hypothetical protein
VIGKLQLVTTQRQCHFWNVALDPTARGLATSALPSDGRWFDIDLDFIEHMLTVRSSDGQGRVIPLEGRTVAAFYDEVMAALESLGFHVSIWPHPVELVDEVIPFRDDHLHRAYDRAWVTRFWGVVLRTVDALSEFRSRFVGKSSAVGFYWGTFDVSVSLFPGRRAPHPPTGTIEREAFSHELSEVGFWPGDARYEEPAFFAMHAPAPDGYSRARLRPSGAAFWHQGMGCFLLPYEAVRTSARPRATLLEFFDSAYVAGAELAHWNRAELERTAPAPVP